MRVVTYWDLSEQERAALTREGVERFIDAELMLKGVLAPKPPEPVHQGEPTLETRTVFVVGGEYSTLPIAFATLDAAQQFLALEPLSIERNWEVGDVRFVRRLASQPVSAQSFPTEAAVLSRVAEIKRATAAKREADERQKAYAAALKQVEKVLEGLWEDWYACCAKARRVDDLVQTSDKYLRLSHGDAAMALGFLKLAFLPEQIAEAEEWLGRKFLAPASEVAA